MSPFTTPITKNLTDYTVEEIRERIAECRVVLRRIHVPRDIDLGPDGEEHIRTLLSIWCDQLSEAMK